MYSRRINIQHRIVYDLIKEEKVVKILSNYVFKLLKRVSGDCEISFRQ